jgi:hypothetical protein
MPVAKVDVPEGRYEQTRLVTAVGTPPADLVIMLYAVGGDRSLSCALML